MIQDLLAFLDSGPSPYHVCAEAARRLGEAGFVAVDETAAWPKGPGRFFMVRDGSIMAWIEPDVAPETPFVIVGAHTDSPNLRLKPNPEFSTVGYGQVGVEVYGSPLLNSWLDRDLGLSGRVSLRDGSTVLIRIDEPLLRIPQLAIHLDREISSKGLLLNAQRHLSPIWAVEPTNESLMGLVAAAASVPRDDVLAWELMVHDLTGAVLCGADGAMVASARLDNQMSCWAAIEMLRGLGDERRVVVGLFDHEEIGSTSATGAASVLLPGVIDRIVAASGGSSEDRYRALAGSVCVSADGAHATHPNYADKHDPAHLVELNGGPVVKINANVRYATTAVSQSRFLRACDAADVPVQSFVSRSDMPCGSTIGPVTSAALGITTVDAGVAQLAMHSARETAGALDPPRFVAALKAFVALD